LNPIKAREKKGDRQMRLEVAGWNLFGKAIWTLEEIIIDGRDIPDNLDHANGHATDSPIDVLGDCRSIHDGRRYSTVQIHAWDVQRSPVGQPDVALGIFLPLRVCRDICGR
jgi:hypothetical protein